MAEEPDVSERVTIVRRSHFLDHLAAKFVQVPIPLDEAFRAHLKCAQRTVGLMVPRGFNV